MEVPQDNLSKRAFDALFDGRYVRALAMIDQLLAGEPGNAVYRCWHSHCLLAAGSPGEALAAAREAVRLAPDLVQAYLPLAWAAVSVNRRDEADEAFRKAADLSGREPYILAEYANFLATEGDVDAAEQAAREAIAAEPESAGAWAALGWVQFRRQDGQAAESSLRRALTLMPDSPRATAYLAIVLRNTGRAAEAAELPQPPERPTRSTPPATWLPGGPGPAKPARPPTRARRSGGILPWALLVVFTAAALACAVVGMVNLVAGLLLLAALLAAFAAVIGAMRMLGDR